MINFVVCGLESLPTELATIVAIVAKDTTVNKSSILLGISWYIINHRGYNYSGTSACHFDNRSSFLRVL